MGMPPLPNQPGAAAPGGAPATGDPSMEDILASIRRILNEDESGTAPPAADIADVDHADAPPAGPPAHDDDVLLLDPSMMVAAPAASAPAVLDEAHEPVPAPFEAPAAVMAVPIVVTPTPTPEPEPLPAPPISAEAAPLSDLLAPESEAAAVSSVGSLLRTLSTERRAQVHRGGPTIEDLVREEIRPLLKGWLDLHLPPMVERLVRAEIERVMGRAAP